jgi:hypothetical protein
MVQARDGLPPRRGRAQDGYAAHDGVGDSGTGLGGGQYKETRQGRAGGPDRQPLGKCSTDDNRQIALCIDI